MFKQRKNFIYNIFWNAKHNLREKGLKNRNMIVSEVRCLNMNISSECYQMKLIIEE